MTMMRGFKDCRSKSEASWPNPNDECRMTNECQRSKDKNKTGRSASHFGFDHSSFFRIYTGCQKKFPKWWGKPAGLPRRPAGRRPPFRKFLLAITLAHPVLILGLTPWPLPV